MRLPSTTSLLRRALDAPTLLVAVASALGGLLLSPACGRSTPVATSDCKPPSAPGSWRLVNGGVAGDATEPGSCRKPVTSSSLPSSRVQHLGVHRVGDVVRFDVPKGTGTISIVSQASSAVVETISIKLSSGSVELPNTVVPTMLTAPNGTTLYDDSRPPSSGETAAVWYDGVASSTGAMTLPNTSVALTSSANGYPEGKWSFTVNDWAAECPNVQGCTGGSIVGEYDVSVVVKPIAAATGTVDLSFYMVTGSLDAAHAIADAHVERFLSTLATLYGRAGLCLGTITFYDVPAWARRKWAAGIDATRTGPCDNLGQMFTLSKAGNALNFFLVDAITHASNTDGGDEVVGLDGTIAGPSSFGGTVQSGAVVNFSDYAAGTGCTGAPDFERCGADATAYITAHEGGHWMGLYHTTEQVGAYYDPLTDTPKCTCSTECGLSAEAAACCYDSKTQTFTGTCAAKDFTRLTSRSCNKGTATCGGSDSLMFWILDNASVGNFSAQQGAVVRANPVVY